MLELLVECLPSNNRFERIWKIAKIDFQRRYYHSNLGLFWALLNPILKIGIYYTVFTYIFKNSIENFAFYMFIGFLFWLSFTEGTNKSFSILRSKRYLLENIQFNKVDLYYSSTFSIVFGFVFNLLAYLLLSILGGIYPSIFILYLPILVVNLGLLILGSKMILSTLHLFIKDIDMLWAIFILGGFWATPIFYDHKILLDSAPWMQWVNPLQGIIVNARSVLLYKDSPNLTLMGYDIFYSIILVFIGRWVLSKFGMYAMEKM